jgi:hypothetical protein
VSNRRGRDRGPYRALLVLGMVLALGGAYLAGRVRLLERLPDMSIPEVELPAMDAGAVWPVVLLVTGLVVLVVAYRREA